MFAEELMRFPTEKNTLMFEIQHEHVEQPGTNRKLGLVDQAMVNRVEGEFEAVGNAEFIENIMQMVLHRLLANEELFPDFAVAEALRYELYDFFLAVTK